MYGTHTIQNGFVAVAVFAEDNVLLSFNIDPGTLREISLQRPSIVPSISQLTSWLVTNLREQYMAVARHDPALAARSFSGQQ